MSRNGSGVYSLPAANYPAVSGTLITAANRNAVDADIATALTSSLAANGETPVSGNLNMANNKLTSLSAGSARTDSASIANIQDGTGIYVGTVGGTADVITLTPSPAIASYVAGQSFAFIASGANTTNVTANVSALGAKAITKNGSTALVAGDIPSGALITIRYDGTRFQLVSNGFKTFLTSVDIQNQSAIAFATTGTGSAYVGAPSPAIPANAENQCFFVEPHTDPTGSPTLAINGFAALNCKYLDSSNVKQFITSSQVKAGNKYRVWNDGTDYIWGDILPTSVNVAKRQAIQYGARTSTGQPGLIPQSQVGNTLAAGVTLKGTTAPCMVSIGNGYNTDGSQKNINLVFTTDKNSGTLAASATNYMWLDGVTGAVGVVSVADVFQYGGTIPVTNNQYTYDYANHIMYLGNGSTASQSNRIIVAEIDTNATVVTAIRVRAYLAEAESALYGLALSSAYTFNHNIGCVPRFTNTRLVNQTTEGGWLPNEEVDGFGFNSSNNSSNGFTPGTNTNILFVGTGVTNLSVIPKAGGGTIFITPANWKLKSYVNRGW